MTGEVNTDSMLDMFIFETIQLIEQLEQLVLDSEKKNGLELHINEIFRIMHTIKGSSAMMLFTNISSLAHAVEDVFYFLRENKAVEVNYSELTDIVLGSIDFIKAEVLKIKSGLNFDGDAGGLINTISSFLVTLKGSTPSLKENRAAGAKGSTQIEAGQNFFPGFNSDCSIIKYKAVLHFEEDCEMENLRAFSVVHKLKEFAKGIQHVPADIEEDDGSNEKIRKDGFIVFFESGWNMDKVKQCLEETMLLKELILDMVTEGTPPDEPEVGRTIPEEVLPDSLDNFSIDVKKMDVFTGINQSRQSYISVNVDKMDKLMDLVGELVIYEALVTRNPDLMGLQLDNFNKAAQQLRKISGELQDIVMSVRMVPLSATFQKMNRILRDMSKKLQKDVNLEIIGEETEVDKNIIEHISDPLMHLIRNAIDHGIESVEERISAGKPSAGKVTLGAKNSGGDVWIIVKDDGKGLDKLKILRKAHENGLIGRDENERTDRDINSLILLPGFTTKDNVTEFSGRGVGMDVVAKSIEQIGGSILIDSKEGEGTAISVKIPLTLAIIDGMIVKVGNTSYIIPTTSIAESFRPKDDNVFQYAQGKEMILIRGECLPILRLYQACGIKTDITEMDEGIIVIVECDGRKVCIFVDELLGQQQVVVKALPAYIRKAKGISGCTLLGDGSVSLILDIEGLLS